MRIVSEENKYLGCKEIEPNALEILSKDRLRILELLNNEPMYPVQIAKKMDMQVQTVYYHIKLLERAGLVEFSEYEEKQGGIAKKYVAKTESVAVVLNKKGWKEGGGTTSKKETPIIFKSFIEQGTFNGKIILGSPDPHGKYRARGSEFCMVELGMLLGRYCNFTFPGYLLDTELREGDKKQNLILAGGPKVNTVVGEINKQLPIYFEENSFDIYSKLSKKKYGENVGLVELVENPFNKKNRILLIGGLNYHGTRAAVLSILKKSRQIEQGNTYDTNVLARIVEGFDEDGDGIIDSVEILE